MLFLETFFKLKNQNNFFNVFIKLRIFGKLFL